MSKVYLLIESWPHEGYEAREVYENSQAAEAEADKRNQAKFDVWNGKFEVLELDFLQGGLR